MAYKVPGIALAAALLLCASGEDAFAAPKKTTISSGKKVKTVVQPSQLNQIQPLEKKKKGTPGVDDNFGKLPTYIKADTLTFKSKERNFVYSGNVEVTHGDMIMTSNSLEGNYDENNQIKDLTAHQNVTIIKGEDMRATGEQAVYDKTTDTMLLTENPELQQNGSVLTADRIRIFVKENRTVAEGQVRVKLLKGKDSEDKDKPSGLKALRN